MLADAQDTQRFADYYSTMRQANTGLSYPEMARKIVVEDIGFDKNPEILQLKRKARFYDESGTAWTDYYPQPTARVLLDMLSDSEEICLDTRQTALQLAVVRMNDLEEEIKQSYQNDLKPIDDVYINYHLSTSFAATMGLVDIPPTESMVAVDKQAFENVKNSVDPQLLQKPYSVMQLSPLKVLVQVAAGAEYDPKKSVVENMKAAAEALYTSSYPDLPVVAEVAAQRAQAQAWTLLLGQ